MPAFQNNFVKQKKPDQNLDIYGMQLYFCKIL